jgi:hypothetical protein
MRMALILTPSLHFSNLQPEPAVPWPTEVLQLRAALKSTRLILPYGASAELVERTLKEGEDALAATA